MLGDTSAGRRAPLGLRRARVATATLFFANGCGLGSWLPHIPDVKIWQHQAKGTRRQGRAPASTERAPISTMARRSP